MPESMLKMRYIVLFGFFYGRLKCSNTDVQYAYMQPVSQDHGRVWLCLAAHCSQDAFSFLIFSLFPAKRVYSDLVVIYFVKLLHVTCSTLKLVMYSWNMEMALQNFVLFLYIFVMHLEFLEQRANRVALRDAALVRCSNVDVHLGAQDKKWVFNCLKTIWFPYIFMTCWLSGRCWVSELDWIFKLYPWARLSCSWQDGFPWFQWLIAFFSTPTLRIKCYMRHAA